MFLKYSKEREEKKKISKNVRTNTSWIVNLKNPAKKMDMGEKKTPENLNFMHYRKTQMNKKTHIYRWALKEKIDHEETSGLIKSLQLYFHTQYLYT